MQNPRRKIILTILLVSLVSLHTTRPIKRLWLTLLAYTNLVVTQGAFRPLNLVTRTPSLERLVFPSGGRSLMADVYRPRPLVFRREKMPGVMLFTPLVWQARTDPRVVNLAQSLARLGYVVLVPERPTAEGTVISGQDVDDARTSLKLLRDLKEVDDERVIPFGLSYGFGPVAVAAASDHTLQQAAPFLAGFGGFTEAKEVLRFALTGAYTYHDVRGISEVDPWLSDLVRQNVRRTVATSTARERFLMNVDPETYDRVYADLPMSFRLEVAQLSPSSVISKLRKPLLLIHSTDDNVIPFTESLRLKDLAGQNATVSLSLVSIFKHGAYKPLTWQNFWNDYVPSLRDSLIFLYRFLAWTETRA